MRWHAMVSGALVFAACTPTAAPLLDVARSKAAIDDQGETVRFTVTAAANGRYGTGQVTVRTDVGSLRSGQQVELDGLGLAYVTASCNINEDAECVERMTATASWTPSGGTEMTAEINVRVGTGVRGRDGGDVFDAGGADAGP